MSCDDRNQDLLLLAHGELGGIRRALMEQHLRHCARCQARRRQLGVLSSLIAGEVRPHEMPAWTPRAAHLESTSISAQRLALCVALAILLAVAATAGAVWSPPSWWSFAPWSRQSQTLDTSCQSNAPANIPINPPATPATQPGALPAGSTPISPSACPSTAPPAPRK